jgi:acyl-ACP thioesterase
MYVLIDAGYDHVNNIVYVEVICQLCNSSLGMFNLGEEVDVAELIKRHGEEGCE